MSFTFGGFDFGTKPPYGVRNVLGPFTQAERDMLAEEFARRPGGKLLAARHRMKTITVEGLVGGTSIADLRSNWAALELAFAKEAQQLKVHRDSTDRYYTATLASPPLAEYRPENELLIFYTAKFLVPSPFAKAASASQDLQSNKTLTVVSGNEYKYAWTVAPGGTVASEPKFTITIPGAGPYGMSKLWVINLSLSPPLKCVVIAAFEASDVIVIDGEAFTVTIDAVAAGNTEGAFPVLDPRVTNNALEVHAIATSAPTLSIQTDWTARYLS